MMIMKSVNDVNNGDSNDDDTHNENCVDNDR